MKIKLGKRLQQIAAMITEHYDHIWDCCCDHGLLGANLLARQAAPIIHFVDVVPTLMHELEIKLARFYTTMETEKSHWKTHCLDVATLPLQQFNGKHLVIIAGIGGNLMTQLVKSIYENNRLENLDFLLCPVNHSFSLRQQLIQLDLSLKNEALVRENERFYEILLISTSKNPHTTINAIGSLMWQTTTHEERSIAEAYLKKTLAHYRRIQLNPKTNVQHIIDAYSNATI